MTREEIMAEVREKGSIRLETSEYVYILDDMSDDDAQHRAYWFGVRRREECWNRTRVELWHDLAMVAKVVANEYAAQLQEEAYDAPHQ